LFYGRYRLVAAIFVVWWCIGARVWGLAAQAPRVTGAGSFLGPVPATLFCILCVLLAPAPHLKSNQHRSAGAPAPFMVGACAGHMGNQLRSVREPAPVIR